jgi:hypothetical protein
MCDLKKSGYSFDLGIVEIKIRKIETRFLYFVLNQFLNECLEVKRALGVCHDF